MTCFSNTTRPKTIFGAGLFLKKSELYLTSHPHLLPYMRCAKNALKESFITILIIEDHIIRGTVFLWFEHDPAIWIDFQNKQLPFIVHADVAAAIA